MSKPIKANIVILLATYNGERYLDVQIKSLLGQTHQDFIIVAHDDGSSDGTRQILLDYQEKFQSKFFILEDNIRCGSANRNFQHLLSVVEFNYAFFCDQDDVWLSNKLETYMDRFKDCSENIACVVYGDLVVVDSNLKVISPSMWQFQNTGVRLSKNIKWLACRNPVTGCAMAINKQAYSISDFSKESVMHDWWIALSVRASGGELLEVTEPLVLYRQHENNVVGATKNGIYLLLNKLVNVKETVRNQIKVYRMSQNLGVFNSVFEFLIYKVRVWF